MQLDEVKLDLDRKFTACQWTRECQRIAAGIHALGLAVLIVRVRETRKGFHIFITLREPARDAMHIVAIQAILGSDYIRESLNVRRVLGATVDTDGAENVLFETKNGFPELPRMNHTAALTRALRREGIKAELRHDPGPAL